MPTLPIKGPFVRGDQSRVPLARRHADAPMVAMVNRSHGRELASGTVPAMLPLLDVPMPPLYALLSCGGGQMPASGQKKTRHSGGPSSFTIIAAPGCTVLSWSSSRPHGSSRKSWAAPLLPLSAKYSGEAREARRGWPHLPPLTEARPLPYFVSHEKRGYLLPRLALFLLNLRFEAFQETCIGSRLEKLRPFRPPARQREAPSNADRAADLVPPHPIDGLPFLAERNGRERFGVALPTVWQCPTPLIPLCDGIVQPCQFSRIEVCVRP